MSVSSTAASRLRTPNRRQTFAPVTSTQRNRRMTMDASSASAIPRGGGGGGGGAAGTSNVAAGGSLSATTNKPKRVSMNSRASMIPRVGRENLIPPTPKALPPTTGGSSSSSSHMATVVNNNRRRTMGGGGGGGGGQYTHVGSEKRRQSILPPTTPTLATAKDPRPLQDKNYQQQCSKKLLDFLNDNGYSDQGYQISLKTLKMPSRKDFISIVTFMLRLVDPTFQDGSMKLEEEISMYFRSLGYPFPISKTSLAAAGATHTWPALLGALVWLLETLQHNAASAADNAGKGKAADGEDETETLESLEELEKKTDQTFFDYLAHAYMAFLREDDTRSELLEQQLADEFEADNTLLVQEIDRVGEMNQTIVEQIADLEKQFVELPVYDKKRHEYATDLEQFHDLIRQMNEHKKTLEHKVQERTAALAEMNTELRQLGDEKEALKQVIATQVLSIDDLPKLENAQKQADEAFVRTTHAKERLKAVISEYREKIDTSMASLEQNLADYNQVIAGLAATNPRFHDFVDMKANFNKDKLLSTQDELLGVDLYETVHPLISRCQRELSDMIGETKAALQEQLDQVDKLEAVNMEKAAKLKILLEKHGRCEGLLMQQTESQQSVLAVRQREVAAMEQKVQLMQAPISAGTVEEQVARLERECAELEALRRQRLEEHDLQTKTVRGKIEQALHLMLQQEEYTQRRLAQLCDYWGNKRSTALLSINKKNQQQHELLHEPNNNNNNKNGAETNDH